MKTDDVMKEIWRIKEQRAKRYDFDVRKMGEALMQEQEKSGRTLISPPKRTERPTG